jgi:hypothetical protein
MASNPVMRRDRSAGIEEWRRRLLVAVGLEPDAARGLAADDRVDLHAFLELVDRGCPAHLAARILAPLDEGRPSC